MRDQVENLLASYVDVYTSPLPNRLSELESKFGDTGFDGIHIGAPEQVELSTIGIPTVTLMSTLMQRSWDINPRKNCVIVAFDLDRSDSRVMPIYKPPTKRLKPMPPKGPKPADLSTTGRSYGAHHRIVGEMDWKDPGTYSISVVEWDRVSNIRSVIKKPNPKAPPVKLPIPQWPWEKWKALEPDFQAQPGSPELNDDIGLTVEQVGTDEKATLLGSFGVTARPIHVIAADPGTVAAKSDIRAGVPVDILRFTLDNLVPEHIQLLAPIKAPGPVKTGDTLKGWFSYPLAKLWRKEETIVYAFVDGMRAGPFRIPALKP